MKKLHTFIFILLISTTLGLAQGGMGPGGGKGSGGGMGPHGKIINSDEQTHKMTNLRTFLSMSDAQLERMENAIREIREMSPEERETLRAKLDDYSNMPKRQRDSMNQAWGMLDQKIKDAWRVYVDGLEQDELDDLRKKMDQLSQSDRFEFRMNLLKEKGLIEKD